MNTLLLSTAYLPPVSYVAGCMHTGALCLEACEHFVKQSYMNRTSIYGANGKLDLSIPLNHHELYSKPVSEIRIAEDGRWKKIHWRSIESAYRKAPYFEFYEDLFKKIFEQPEPSLFQWNNKLLRLVFDLLGMDLQITTTEIYQATPPPATLDRRNFYHPKRDRDGLKNKPYYQVFLSKYGFIPELSIVDLLFNCGKQSGEYLQLLTESTG